jgi:hypothetical protein
MIDDYPPVKFREAYTYHKLPLSFFVVWKKKSIKQDSRRWALGMQCKDRSISPSVSQGIAAAVQEHAHPAPSLPCSQSFARSTCSCSSPSEGTGLVWRYSPQQGLPVNTASFICKLALDLTSAQASEHWTGPPAVPYNQVVIMQRLLGGGGGGGGPIMLPRWQKKRIGRNSCPDSLGSTINPLAFPSPVPEWLWWALWQMDDLCGTLMSSLANGWPVWLGQMVSEWSGAAAAHSAPPRLAPGIIHESAFPPAPEIRLKEAVFRDEMRLIKAKQSRAELSFLDSFPECRSSFRQAGDWKRNCEGEENTHMWWPYPWRGVVGWSCVPFFCILVFFRKKIQV